MPWKNKVCTKQISQNKKRNRLCSLKKRNIKKEKNLIVVELLIPPKAQRKKKKQPEVHQTIWWSGAKSKFDEGQNSEKNQSEV